jgi:hypothetical protein
MTVLEDKSLAERWMRSPTAQGVALGLILGPAGMLLAYVFSVPDKRRTRLMGALWGSLTAGSLMLVGILLGAIAVSAL